MLDSKIKSLRNHGLAQTVRTAGFGPDNTLTTVYAWLRTLESGSQGRAALPGNSLGDPSVMRKVFYGMGVKSKRHSENWESTLAVNLWSSRVGMLTLENPYHEPQQGKSPAPISTTQNSPLWLCGLRPERVSEGDYQRTQFLYRLLSPWAVESRLLGMNHKS